MGRNNQPDLFGDGATPAKFEIHDHHFITGARANRAGNCFSHSHDGGDRPHRHPETGPGSYVIDRDEWFKLTGLQGGGRKEFTSQPSGEQFPLASMTAEETSFAVIGYDPPSVPPGFKGTGGGVYALSRMVLGSKMRPAFRVIPGGKQGKANG